MNNSTGYKNVLLQIRGMHCLSCVKIIENALKSLDGIVGVNVNFATEQANITYIPDKLNIGDIATKIEKIGYHLDYSEGVTPKANTLSTISQKHDELKELGDKLFLSLSATIVIAFLSMHHMFLSKPLISKKIISDLLLFLLTTPVQFWIGWQFHKGLWIALKNKTADMNTLISVGTTMAYVYSIVATLTPSILSSINASTATHYDTSAVIITIVLFGRFLEIKSRQKTNDVITKLLSLKPNSAMVLRNGIEVTMPVNDIQVSDIVIVKPGERIPLDGKIIDGFSTVDESMITGESTPLDKKVGDGVIGGTINLAGSFKFVVTKIGSETVLAQIIKLVSAAQSSRAPIQRYADKVAKVFVPAVILTAIITFILWMLLGSEQKLTHAVVSSISVLIIACPCAMGLATPTAIVVGIGRAAQKGILIKKAEILEVLGGVNIVVFDKTGTLTNGQLAITDVVSIDTSSYNADDVLEFAAIAEKRSEHPIARAILHRLGEVVPPEPEEFIVKPGLGVEAKIGNKAIFVGNARFMSSLNRDVLPYKDKITALERGGKTLVFISDDNRLIGIIAVSDTVRRGVKEIIGWLKMQNIEVIMLTGDSERTAKAIASQVNIRKFISEVLPSEKVSKIKSLQLQKVVEVGKRVRVKKASVAMVGDGINDAPSLIQADIGIAIGSGTDIAIESADIVLVKGGPDKIKDSIILSKKVIDIIKQNMFWAFFYNIALIPVAAGVLYPLFGLTLSPEIAAIAMAASSVTVVTNSLRLKRA